MQREEEKKVSHRSGRITEQKQVRFLLGGKVFYPRSRGGNSRHVSHGDKRPRSTSHEQVVEPSNETKVNSNRDDGHRKELRWEQNSERVTVDKRPKTVSDKQAAGQDGPRKEVKWEPNRDRGAGHHGLKIRTSSLSENLQKYPPNCPAKKIIWKGCFEVIGNIPEEDMRCDDFLAHFPIKLSLKAYEFLKKIPQTLQFRMCHRHKVWPEIFQTARPNSFDIALYFYPDKFERSIKMYGQLLKYLVANDMALRAHMGSVELLVSASKLLNMDSQKQNGNYFMWGVFCSLKDKKS